MFEFNEADQRVAYDTVDFWIESQSGGKTNIAPEKIPWVALRTLLSQTIYGGRIDNRFDQRILDSFLQYLFTEKSFDADFSLTSSSEAPKLVMPDGNSKVMIINKTKKK